MKKNLILLLLILNLGFAEIKTLEYTNGNRETINYVKGKREDKYIYYDTNGSKKEGRYVNGEKK